MVAHLGGFEVEVGARVQNPGAIEMHLELVLLGNLLLNLVDVVEAQDLAIALIMARLEANESGDLVVRISSLAEEIHLVKVNGSIRHVLKGDGHHTSDCGDVPPLPVIEVRHVSNDSCVPLLLTVEHNANQVGHRATGHK